MTNAGVANPEMTFADTSGDPVPKRRKQSKAGKAPKASKAVEAEDERDAEAAAAELDETAHSGSLKAADSEPAELARTGAAEVAADAEVSIAEPPGTVRGSSGPKGP